MQCLQRFYFRESNTFSLNDHVFQSNNYYNSYIDQLIKYFVYIPFSCLSLWSKVPDA